MKWWIQKRDTKVKNSRQSAISVIKTRLLGLEKRVDRLEDQVNGKNNV
jgi:hypothetical protein